MAFFHGSANAGNSNEGDFIVKPGCRHWRYTLNKQGVTEIRVVPAIGADGKPEPLIDLNRGNELYEHLTDAIAFFDVVSFLGPGKVSMICPIVEGEAKGPVQTLIDTIKNETKHNPKGCDDKWHLWCGNGVGVRDVMSSPSNVAMLQGYLYTHKGVACVDRDGKQSPKSPVLLQLTRTATKEFCDKLGKTVDPNSDWSSVNNELGDFVDPQEGRLLRFTPYPVTYNNNPQTWYHAETCPDVVIPLGMDDIMAVWKPWDEVVNWKPTLQEVGGWLVKAFDASTVVKIFENHPTYCQCITDNIRSIAEREAQQAVGRVQVGYAGYGQQPAQYTAYPPQPSYQQPPLQQAPPTVGQAAYTPQTTQPAAPRPPQYSPPRPQQAAPAAPPAYNPPVGLSGKAPDPVADEDPELPFDNNVGGNNGNVTFRRQRR